MQVSKAKESGIGNFLRRKSMLTVRDDIDHLVKNFHPKFLYIIDDSFTARPKKETLAFCEMYEEFKIPFWFNTRPEATDLDVLVRLKEVGAYRISYGLESGNEQYRKKVLRRQGSNKELTAAFNVIAESGIPYSLNLIIGLPGETRDLIMDTVRFTKTIRGFDMNSHNIQIKMEHIGSYNDRPDGFIKDITAELIPEYAREIAIYFEQQNLKRKMDRTLGITK